MKSIIRNPFEHFDLKSDLLAALLVAVILVPQGLAYASLAGLPPIYGLYAGFIPMAVYPFFGSSRHLSVGPVALVSIILFAGLASMATPGSPEFIQLALLTAFVAGCIQIILAYFKMGFLINFLSDPVIHGFTTAAACIIILSQLKSLLGISIEGNMNALEQAKELILQIPNLHMLTALVGIMSLAIILLIKRLNKKIPISLIVVVLATALTFMFRLDEKGVRVIEYVQSGIPTPTFEFIVLENMIKVLPLSFVICLISFIESLAIAKAISARHGYYRIGANNELLGLGVAKLIGSFFHAFPNTGSFSRSAINDKGGAQSGASSIFAAIIIGLTLLFFTSLFYYLPYPILAAIVIAAVLGLIDLKYAKTLYAEDRKDFYVFLTTCIATFIFGIQTGVIVGMVLSFFMILRKTSKPHYAVLGQLPKTSAFRNINRYPQAITNDDTIVVRYDQDIYFGNARHFHRKLLQLTDRYPKANSIVLNAGVISDVDSTGIAQMKLLLESLKAKNIRFFITHLRGPVRDKLKETGILKIIGPENIYLTVHDAVYRRTQEGTDSKISKGYASQSGYDQMTNIIE